MKVFVSHSMKDQEFLTPIKASLDQLGIDLLLSEPGVKTRNLIQDSDVGLILLTEESIKSGQVKDEISNLEATNKPLIVILEEDVEEAYNDLIWGKDYLVYDPDYPETISEKIESFILSRWSALQKERQNVTRSLERWEKRKVWAGVGMLAMYLLLVFGE